MVAKQEFQAKEEEKQIEKAEPHFPRGLPMGTWVAHFKRVLQAKESCPSIGYQEEEINAPPPLFTKEVEQ